MSEIEQANGIEIPRFDYECAFCGGEGNADERCNGMIMEPDHPASVEMVPKGTRKLSGRSPDAP